MVKLISFKTLRLAHPIDVHRVRWSRRPRRIAPLGASPCEEAWVASILAPGFEPTPGSDPNCTGGESVGGTRLVYVTTRSNLIAGEGGGRSGPPPLVVYIDETVNYDFEKRRAIDGSTIDNLFCFY